MVTKGHDLSIREQCKLLGVNRSSLYYCPEEAFIDSQLINRISEIHQSYPYYGYRKVHWHLTTKDGYNINRKKVQRLMWLAGIRAIFPGPKTSMPCDHGQVYPYLLKGLEIKRANHVWAVDITYIKLPVGMVYLFALIDWHSRFIVAHKLVNTMEASHAVEALEMALTIAIPEICNADQGSQFTGSVWIIKLQEYAIQISHDGVGRCIDNIRIERFWRTIKYEDIFIQAYSTLPAARVGIKAFIEHYNYHRPHQALGYKTPAEVYCGLK
jgi:putative transposase